MSGSINKSISVIVGLGFGDEGKGSTVNYLSNQLYDPLVVRFSGGHQVGHTVVQNGKRHVFSNFGSGTLSNVPTYWSEYCTINPLALFKECNKLETLDVHPDLFIDGNAMVTTPYDIIRNQGVETHKRHGSVGVGFGTTIQRNEDNYRLYARDLAYPKIRDAKLKNIQELYYRYGLATNPQQMEMNKKLVEEFVDACKFVVNRFNIITNPAGILTTNNLIFEGSQGILLDMQYGFFPNVTRAHTTSRNAFDLIKKYGLSINDVETYYVTRAYQTRHGNGFMTNEDMDVSYIKENPLETNVENAFQGKLRKGILDIEMLEYALSCDARYNDSVKKIVFTCLDQVPEEIPTTYLSNNVVIRTYEEIGNLLGFVNNEIFGSFGDEGIK